MLELKYNTKSDNDYKVITSLDYKMIAFTPNRIGKWNSFVYDSNLQKYYTFNKDARNYSILDIHPNGKYVMIVTAVNTQKTNTLEIINLDTKDTVITIKDYFVYEAHFTYDLRFILCRAKIYSDIKTFVYDIVDGYIVLELKINDFVLNGSFEKTRERYCYVQKYDGNDIIIIDFKTMNKKKLELKYYDTTIKKLYFTENNSYFIKDIYDNIILYTNGKIESIIKTSEYLPKYIGDILIMDDNKTIYYDTPIHLYNSENILQETILYKIDYHKGSVVKRIKLPTSCIYTKFYRISEVNIIDTNCNIIDITTMETSKFEIDKYK